MKYGPIILFHLFYYSTFSVLNFVPQYLGNVGMTDGQIGSLISISAIIGVCFQPFFGVLTDRVRYKKTVLIMLALCMALACLVLDRLHSFLPLLLALCAFSIFQLPIAGINATISLEYMTQMGRPYGPVRLIGTLGYQLGALLPGALLLQNLDGLYQLLAAIIFASALVSMFLPAVRGHQHARQKVPLLSLLADKHFAAMLLLVTIGATTTQYYMTFFVRHMGNLGVDNSIVGRIFLVSVLLEYPFLFVADKLARRVSVWNWFLAIFFVHGIRWLGISATKSIPLLFVLQMPEVLTLACFEYFPALYINRHIPDEQKGSAQMLLVIMAFGVSKVIGSMVGGFASEWVGIPNVFAFNGVMLLVVMVCAYRPTRRLVAEEKARAQSLAIEKAD